MTFHAAKVIFSGGGMRSSESFSYFCRRKTIVAIYIAATITNEKMDDYHAENMN